MLPRDVCVGSASLPPHYCDGLFLRRTSLLEDRVRTLPATTFAYAMIGVGTVGTLSGNE